MDIKDKIIFHLSEKIISVTNKSKSQETLLLFGGQQIAVYIEAQSIVLLPERWW